MGHVVPTHDSLWPSAASLITPAPVVGLRNVGLLGVSTYSSSLTPRSWHSTPSAIREALERYSTWSYGDGVDLAREVALIDYGDVFDPNGLGGRERVHEAVAKFDSSLDARIILGGDNAATWLTLAGLANGDFSNFGLITLDAHHDLRDGESNGSPVRQLLDAGLDGAHVVQVGIADFSNSAMYAARARDAGITVLSRSDLRARSLDSVLAQALDVAGEGGRRIYVDIDMDVADLSVVPGCPAAAPGGLSADELRQAARYLASDPRVDTIDITEIDVERDSADQRTVRLAALLVLEVLAGVRRRSR